MDLASLASTLPSLTWGFIIVTSLIGVLLLTVMYSPAAVIYGPGLLVSIGIFGTFLGIALGLSDFDTTRIQESIPGLLSGLKTSFWSSIAGLWWALLIKSRQLVQVLRAQQEGTVATGATVDDLANILNEVKQGLTGGDEATVTGQIKLTRSDMNERLDALRKELSEFMEEMASSSAEKLIEALEAVIRDFNAKINEQFGDNFRQLNEAVGKILEWQSQYRVQMAEMIVQQRKSAESMTLATERYSQVVERSESFTETAKRLESVLTALNTEADQIQELCSGLAQVLGECKTSLPNMEKKVVELSGALEKSIKQTNEVAIRTITAANNELNQHLKTTSEKTQKQVTVLEKALEEQLTRSLETFGRQLAALSEKFVSDYTPLTQQLARVVRMAQGTAQ